MLKRFIVVPAGILVVAVSYWFLSYDPAGTTMLAIFGIAMGLYGVILLPAARDVGPTAPVDPDWEPMQRPDLG
jgi:hypothetical protein